MDVKRNRNLDKLPNMANKNLTKIFVRAESFGAAWYWHLDLTRWDRNLNWNCNWVRVAGFCLGHRFKVSPSHVCNTHFNRISCSGGKGEGYNRWKSYAGLTVSACVSLHKEAHARTGFRTGRDRRTASFAKDRWQTAWPSFPFPLAPLSLPPNQLLDARIHSCWPIWMRKLFGS